MEEVPVLRVTTAATTQQEAGGEGEAMKEKEAKTPAPPRKKKQRGCNHSAMEDTPLWRTLFDRR